MLLNELVEKISRENSPSVSTGLSQKELVEKIQHLKKEKNAVILGHYYQEDEIQDLADYVGDSLGLAQQGAKTSADMIVLAGVVFMAETAKILSPEKKVVFPDAKAGCSLSDNCPPDQFKAFIEANPGHTVVTYVNSSVEVKALSDILCTSSNAEKIINSIPKSEKIIFAPDRHLGAYLSRKTGRKMLLWQGSCIVHETFDAKNITQLKIRFPNSLIIAHPECPESVLNLADHIGSTSALLKYTTTSPHNEFIVATESGIIHQMKKANPNKIFHPAPIDEACSCAECPYMRLNTLEKLYLCMKNETPFVTIDPELQRKALIPLERMLALS